MNIDLLTIIFQLRGIQPQQFVRAMQERSVIPSDQVSLHPDRVVYLRDVYRAPLLRDNLTARIEKKVDRTKQPPQESHKLEVWQSTTLLATYEGPQVVDIWNTIDKRVHLYENERFYTEHGGGD